MDRDNFRVFMKQVKKPARTIDGYVQSVAFYEGFLHSHRQVHSPDNASPMDLEAFAAWGGREGENVYRHLWGIRTYYEFIQNEDMAMRASEWMEYLQNETRKLGEFPTGDRDSVKKLAAIGITTVNQLLRAGDTPEKLQEICEQSGAPQARVMDLFKLSHLARLPGLKKVRGRLFFEAGLDTLAKIAALAPEEVQRLLMDYVDKTGFDGTAPTPGEAQFTVRMARFLPENLRQ